MTKDPKRFPAAAEHRVKTHRPCGGLDHNR